MFDGFASLLARNVVNGLINSEADLITNSNDRFVATAKKCKSKKGKESIRVSIKEREVQHV